MEQASNSKVKAVIAVVVLAVIVVAAWFAYSAISTDSAKSAGGQQVSAAASNTSGHWDNPALSSLTMDDAEGYPITLGTLADGKVTVVNVWASWCHFCVDEMQDYQGLYDKYGDKVQFVMLDSAENAQEVESAHDYVKEQGFTFPVFYDTSQELQKHFSVAAYPTTIVIGSNGEVLSNKPGRIVTSSLDSALAGLVG